jgi:hypothetical protein
MSLGLKHMARTGKDPSAWIYDYRIDWQNPITRPHLPLAENATGRKP